MQVTYEIPPGQVAAVKQAVDHHLGDENTVGWTDQDYADWLIDRARADVRTLTFQMREARRPDIDRTDPTRRTV